MLLKFIYKYKNWIPKFSKKPIENNVEKYQILSIINAYYKLDMRIDEALMLAAMDHAKWMDSKGVLSHIGKDGKTHGYRLALYKYSGSYVAEYLIIYSERSQEQISKLLIKKLILTSCDSNINFRKFGYGKKNQYWCFLLGK